MGCLYKIEFENGKSYIGITKGTAEQRLRGHIKDSKRDFRCKLLARAIAKGHKFVLKTLVMCDDRSALYEMERRAITAYETKAPHGYNLTDGGDGRTGTGFPPLTDAHKAKLSAAAKGRCPSDANRISTSVANKGNKYAVTANIGNKNASGSRLPIHGQRISVGRAFWKAVREGRAFSPVSFKRLVLPAINRR